MYKRVLLLCILACILLTGCSQGNTTSAIQKNGVLTVALEHTFPPFIYLDENGNYTGIDVEIVGEIAADLGVDVSLKPHNFSEIFESVKKGDVDLGVAGISITPDRLREFSFSDPYFTTNLRLMVSTKAMDTIASGETIDADFFQRKVVGVEVNSVGHALLLEMGDVEILPTISEAETKEALLWGKIDVAVVDEQTGQYFVDLHKDDVCLLPAVLGSYNYGTLIAKNNVTLQASVNSTLARLISSGELEDIISRHTNRD